MRTCPTVAPSAVTMGSVTEALSSVGAVEVRLWPRNAGVVGHVSS